MEERYIRNLGALTERECAFCARRRCSWRAAAALCTRLLTGRPLETGRLYAADLLDMEIEGLS